MKIAAMIRLAIAILVLAAWPVMAQRLEAPFDVTARRATMGRPLAAAPCPAPPPPQVDVLGETFYSDPAFSIVDPARQARSREMQRPFDAFADAVLRPANDYVRARPADPARAACALAVLDHWARAGAMLGRDNVQGGFTRKWTLNAIALGFLMIRDEPSLDPAARERAARWLGQVARKVMPPYTNPPPTRMSAFNNHANWAAAAVMHAGVAANDRALFDWGVMVARRALDQVDQDGALPHELFRARRAMHYHVFALAPLAQAALTARVNGIDLTAMNDRALDRLARRTAAGMADPAWFTQRTGIAQEWPAGSGRGDHAWIEIYAALTGARAFATVLRDQRPIGFRWLGGDVTLLFGTPI